MSHIRPKFPKKGPKKLSLLTAYDAVTAEVLEQAGIDCLLVGDSVGMVLLGYTSTQDVTMDEMIHHAKAVRRGAKKSFIIGDVPLLGVEKGPGQALASSRRFIDEAGCNAVKLEWNRDCLKAVKLLVRHRIPVMGHIGLTPQTADSFRVQGRDKDAALSLLNAAKALEAAGAFALILECMPWPLAKTITEQVKIPTIGIGAGSFCDGQVLVFQDLVGIYNKLNTRFVRRYAHLDEPIRRAVKRYILDVRTGRFPGRQHRFGMDKEELRAFNRSVSEMKNRGKV